MNSESLVTLTKRSYRGTSEFRLGWTEAGAAQEKTFETEAEAVVEMSRIEERLRTGVAAGKGMTINPFGELSPYVTSKDVQFAALKLQPRGLAFRDVIVDYVEASGALRGLDATVAHAARDYAEAAKLLKPFDVSLGQAVFEWCELKKQMGDKPLSELLRSYLKSGSPALEPPGKTSTG